MIKEEHIHQYSMGPNPIRLLDWNLENVSLDAEAVVLDLGCGQGLSTIHLIEKYGCKIVALEKWTNITDVWSNLRTFGVEDSAIPIQGDARNLPFPKAYFSHVIATDSYIYFGTDDTYAPYIWQFLAPDGLLCFTVPGFNKDVKGQNHLPKHLEPFFDDECWTWHTRDWWRTLIERTGRFEVLEAKLMPDSFEFWKSHYLRRGEYRKETGQSFENDEKDLAVVEEDQGEYLGFIKIVAKKRP